MKYFPILLALLFLASGAEAQTAEIPQLSVTVSPTVSTSPAYSVGDLVGGKLTLTPILCPRYSSGYITSVKINDTSKQLSPLNIVFFKANPTGTTFTDNAAFAPAAADQDKISNVVPLDSANNYGWSVSGTAYRGSIAEPMVIGAQGVSTFYAAIVSNGTPTYATTTAISLTVTVACDLQKAL